MHLIVSQNKSGAVKHFLQYCDEANLFVLMELKEISVVKWRNAASDTSLKNDNSKSNKSISYSIICIKMELNINTNFCQLDGVLIFLNPFDKFTGS